MKIRKRDGRIVAFDDSKITDAIFAAAQAVGGADREMAVEITLCVLKCLKAENKEIVDVEHVQDIVEKVLIKKRPCQNRKILYFVPCQTYGYPQRAQQTYGYRGRNFKGNRPRQRQYFQFAIGKNAANCIGCQPRILFEPCYSGRNGGGA